jgi:hypothetical protein
MRLFHDLNPVLEASVYVINVVGQDVQIDLAAVLRARFPT